MKKQPADSSDALSHNRLTAVMLSAGFLFLSL